MIKNNYYESHAFYDDNARMNEVFSDNDIAVMFYTLIRSKDYLKNIYGEWMKARDLCILAALRYMLLRPKEACCLMFKDLNFKKMQIHIRGETNKEKKDRFLCIPDKFLSFYKYYMGFPKWLWKNSEFLFPSFENGHISPGRWKTIMREKILKPAGVYEPPVHNRMPRTRSYLLRASGATELLDKGADPWTVAQTLGHGDLRTIKNYFFQTERFREHQKEFLNKIN